MSMEFNRRKDGKDGGFRMQLELDPNSDEGRSMTKQEFSKESDINAILKRFEKTGMIDHVNNKTPNYMDVSGVRDYREAIENVRVVDEYFTQLPADLRARFANDPAVFLDFMSDGDNYNEAVKLGLIPNEGSNDVPANVPAVPETASPV